MSGPVRVHPLRPEQAAAADPDAHAWVAASAGTGKTQVLAARVLRLLLAGVPAQAILCITFTRAAAAEMQGRVMRRLAYWARAEEQLLAAELAAIGEADDLATRTRARRLFAQLLDAPQGLNVATIHALAQSLIAAFPMEAGVAPGFQTLDDRAAQALRRRLLAEAIEDASRSPDARDQQFLHDIATLSLLGGEQKLARLSALAGRHAEAMAALPDLGMEPLVRRSFGMPTDETADQALARTLAGIDRAALQSLAAALAQGGSNAQAQAVRARAWLADETDLESLFAFCFTGKGEVRKEGAIPKAMQKADPALLASFERLVDAVQAVRASRAMHAAVARVAAQLRVAARLSRQWLRAKQHMGVVDYDDMIAAARRLLAGEGAAAWVRYKLDQRIDHVLVDEAQDTNLAQWDIIRTLTEEFFAGEGAREASRRLFVVGDFKQAIYGFQGSDPRIYRDMRGVFEGFADDAGTPLRTIPLTRNFRSLPTILQLVDAVVAEIGEAALDADGVPSHVAHRQGAGEVLLLPPTQPAPSDTPESDEEDAEAGEDGARPGAADIAHARALAARIAGWLSPEAPRLLPARGRPIRPQDILVLVRRRTAFSAALVAALHGHGVPVAGVDRLKLSEPLAVADLLALVRFVLQPADDLTLASLLVSPFLGLDHDRLFALAHQRPATLWEAVRASPDPQVAAARDWLTELLSFADFTAPYEFFERVLSGPLKGRQKLLARLGAEARDAIETVLDQALAFEAVAPPSLQGFLAWIEADDVEIKRDPDAPYDAVRLMTVHGAKGLQAPVVILADALYTPRDKDGELLYQIGEGEPLPIDPGSAALLTGPLAKALAARKEEALKEHWRLLYVALTRAEDLLLVSGSLTPRKNGEPKPLPQDSWYARVAAALQRLGAEDTADGLALRTGAPVLPQPQDLAPASGLLPLPDWVRAPAPPEARPSRPLSPSALAEDQVSAPPLGPSARAAAARGTALHTLFERLPGLPPAARAAAGIRLARQLAPEADPEALVAEVLRILDDPAHAALFGDHALAEAPIAAVVGQTVVAGQVDRLLITDSHVLIVDFKTGRRVPASIEDAPPYHLAQMAAYAAALRQIFPAHKVEAALLYTAGPRLLTLSQALLAAHAPELNRPPASTI